MKKSPTKARGREVRRAAGRRVGPIDDLHNLDAAAIKVVEDAEARLHRRTKRAIKWALAICLVAFIGTTLGRAWSYEQTTRVLVTVDGVSLSCERVMKQGRPFLRDCEAITP